MSRFRIMVTLAAVSFGLVTAWMTTSWSYSRAVAAQSPLANSTRLAPAQPDLFYGKIKPVPELISRAEAADQGRAIPSSVLGLEMAEKYVAQLRDTQKLGPSGVWILTSYYFSFRDSIQGHFQNPESLAWFDNDFAKWRAKDGQAPGPYILKGYILRDLVINNDQPLADLWSMQTRTAKLSTYLAEVKPIAAKDPAWYMLQINAMSFTCDMREVWNTLEEGSQAFPTFYQIYFEALLAELKCGDNPKSLIARLTDLGTERTKATEGQSFYARLLWVVSSYWSERVLVSNLVDWKRMKASMHDVLDRYPDAWNVNNFAHLACVGRQADIARELLPKAREAPVVKVWKSNEKFQECWDWAMSAAAKE